MGDERQRIIAVLIAVALVVVGGYSGLRPNDIRKLASRYVSQLNVMPGQSALERYTTSSRFIWATRALGVLAILMAVLVIAIFALPPVDSR